MKTITNDNFEQEVLQSKIPVMIKFTASWCGPCRVIQPILEEVAKEVEGKAEIVKLDIDDSSELAAKFKVKSIPTMIVFKNGEAIKTQIGSVPKSKILALFELEDK